MWGWGEVVGGGGLSEASLGQCTDGDKGLRYVRCMSQTRVSATSSLHIEGSCVGWGSGGGGWRGGLSEASLCQCTDGHKGLRDVRLMSQTGADRVSVLSVVQVGGSCVWKGRWWKGRVG